MASGGCILVACIPDGQVVGSAVIKKKENKGVFELGKLAVRPAFHRKGIGKALTIASIENVRSLGGRTIKLETSHRLAPAIALYQKLGFEACKPPPEAYQKLSGQYIFWVFPMRKPSNTS